MSTVLRKGKLAHIEGELRSLTAVVGGTPVNPHEQFAGFEFMCRARAALAKKEMEYWLAEAEEWKQIRELPEPFIQGRVIPDTGYSKTK